MSSADKDDYIAAMLLVVNTVLMCQFMFLIQINQ